MMWWSPSVARRWVGVAGAAVVLGASAVAGQPSAMAASCVLPSSPVDRLTGDWDGDGVDTVGLFDPVSATWFLRNANTAGRPDLCFRYGSPGVAPVVGDWDGDGTDTVGVVRRTAGVDTWRWILKNSNTAGGGDVDFRYGHRDNAPITGDWDGDGDTNIGVVETGVTHLRWHLRRANSGGGDSWDFLYGRSGAGGTPSDSPVVGDWDGNGTDTVGVIRWAAVRADEWNLRNANTPGYADIVFRYGSIPHYENEPQYTGAHMVVGDWNGDGRDDPGTVGWVRVDDPTTPSVELLAQWGLRYDTSTGPDDRKFGYGTALAGVPRTYPI
ncbi:MAG TPA: hypothetical protein VK453_27635 [Micromonosporaceae bacterium]|nr:hypothetical protein [Micromonosporaceae bacterium]